MKRFFLICLPMLLLPVSAVCQQGPSQARVDAIWDKADTRISNQADIWFHAGFFPTCVNLLRFMYSEDPSDYDTATNLGWMLENINMYKDALAVYVKFRKDNPNEPDASFPEANFYFQEKAYSKVPPLLESTIAKHPQENAYRLLAHSYERLGLYPDALRIWKQLVADHPGDVAAKLNLAKIQRRLGMPTKPGQ